jgi:hypothetical protein
VIIFFIVIAALLVLVIGLVAVGQLAGRLAAEPPTSLYDLDEAVEFVADRLPEDVTADLTYDDVRKMLTWHLDYLRDRGIARSQGENELVSGPLVAAEDDALAYVLGRAADSDLAIDDVWVAQVIAGNEAYLEAIGAIGAQLDAIADADENGDPTA